MSLVYKTLFEIKVLHEYYHTSGDGKTIFSIAAQPDRISFLMNEFNQGKDSINKDLGFEFPEPLQSSYKGKDIKIHPSYSGFKVSVRVKPIVLADNSLVYEPFVKLPDNIFIRIVRKNDGFDRYTQSRIAEPIPAVYLFSNQNLNGTRAFPYLTNSISAVNPSGIYEQGELAEFGDSDIREFSVPQWHVVKGTVFANRNDLMLLSRKFSFSLEAAGIRGAEIVLKDAARNTIKTISVSNSNLRIISLDFESLPDISNLHASFASGLYTLEVRGSDNFFQQRQFVFSDSLFEPGDAGVIHIATNPVDAAFHILANDGYLFRRRLPSGTWTDTPIFEIPFKGRSAFWRYRNNKGKKILFNPNLTGYLQEEDDFVISRKPLAISKYHFVLHKDGTNETKYFPNPMDYSLKRDNKHRFCFDIVVPDSKLFPV